MSPANLTGQFGDTTYTKVFVGGLAWETKKETMKKYFEQFGDILEAVVIIDNSTGRSKGYGFVTFHESESAMKACVDASPVIDGRRANCNLASFGVQRSKPSTPRHGGSKNFRGMRFGGMGTSLTYPHYGIQQGIPYYNLYGYSSYSPDYTYPPGYYNVYGGATATYPFNGTGTGRMMSGAAAPFYPYAQFGEGSAGYTVAAQGYGVQYPYHQIQYSAAMNSIAGFPQQYGAPMSLATTSALPSGLTMAVHAPKLC